MLSSKRDRRPLPPQEFASLFEVIGENCEPGLIQRCLGAEPLGLLRFAGGSIDSVIDVIETDGRHLFSEDDVEIQITDEGEYFLRSKYYNDFPYHTFVYEKDVDREEFLKKRLPVIAYLKSRFFSELRDGDKIYVRMGAESRVELRRLQRALSRHKPRILLNVAQADAFHPPGTIERIGSDLWRGYVQWFKNFATADPFDLASWLSILSSVSVRAAHGPRCTPNRGLETSRAWTTVGHNATPAGRGPDSVPAGDALTVTEWSDDGRFVASLDVPLNLEDETLVVVSAGVWLDRNYDGYPLHLVLGEAAALHQRNADPELRGCWQQVFVAAKVQARQARITLGLRAPASPGSRMVLGSVSVEAGVVPGARLDRGIAWSVRARRAKRRATTMIERMSRAKGKGAAAFARAAIAQGAFVEADDHLTEALARAPADAELLKLYATSAHNSGRYVAAIHRWQKALEAAPDDPMCYAALACNFREYGVLDRAHALISAGLHHFPDDLAMLTEAARIAFARRQHGESACLYDRAIALYGAHDEWIQARDKAEAASA